jgi:vitamin B12 transporter
LNKIKLFLILLIFLLFQEVNLSQNNIVQKTDTIGLYKLTDVVVTATKTPTSTIEIASSISIIDSAEISNSNAINVLDLVKNEVGVDFSSQGGNGSLSNVSIRGADNSHTLVLIDGVEVNLANDPKGVFDFSALPVDNIERIEILRGPQSTLYGSDALGGIINVITKQGFGSPKFSVLAEGGTYNTYKTLLELNGAIQKLNYSIAVGRKGSDGFSVASEKYGNTEKDGYTFNNVSSNVGYELSDNFKVRLLSRFVKSKSDNDQFGGMFGDDPTYITEQEEISNRLEGKLNLFDGFWNQKVGISYLRNVRKNSYDTSYASIYYSRAFYDGRRYKLDWQNDLQLAKSNLLTAGVDFEIDKSTSDSYYLNYIGLDNYINVSPLKQMRTLGFYLQDQAKFEDSFFITFGIRSDHHSQFGSNFTYSISPAYIFWESGTKFKVNIGTGFKTPTLYSLFDPQYGNLDLKPEKSFGFDFGIEQYIFSKDFMIGADLFFNKFSDMITLDYTQLKNININKAVTRGGEFYLEYKPVNELDIKLNYTLTDSKDQSTESEYFGMRLLRKPTNKVGFYTSYSFLPEANINLEIIWVGNRDDVDFTTYPVQRVELKGFVLANFAAHYNIFNFLRLNIRIENLLNTDYEEVFGYGTAGFSVYGGLNLTLE